MRRYGTLFVYCGLVWFVRQCIAVENYKYSLMHCLVWFKATNFLVC